MPPRVWRNIYDGNVSDRKRVVDKFMHKYWWHIFARAEQKCDPITGDTFKDACN